MAYIYWKSVAGMIEAWVRSDEGREKKTWFRFRDIPALYYWAQQHGYTPREYR